MTHRDRGIVAVLGVVLVALAIATALPGPIANPGPTPTPTTPIAGPSATPSGPPDVVYREGVIGRPSSINPLTARTQADRDLVALVFSGLVKLGPDGTYLPDLASGWTVDPKGKSWTFAIRPDAQWQDGVPVTADDVVFTVGVLKSPGYTGALAASWNEVNVVAVDPQTVTFTLTSPIGGFLQAATIGLLPSHLLSETPVERLADDPFSLQPVGSGPYVLTSWSTEAATLVPVSAANQPVVADPSSEPSASGPPSPTPTVAPTATPGGSASGAAPSPSAAASPSVTGGVALPGIQLSFYPDAAALAAAFRAGDLDAASGLPPELANQLAAGAGNRLLEYPRTTLTAIALNLRPGNSELRIPALRHGLLATIDRSTIINDVYGGAATRADSPIPPSSWAFDPKASRQVRLDLKRAAADFKKAGWRKLTGGWAAPGARKPFAMEIITPDADSNPRALAVAEAVAADWRAFGLQTTVSGLTPTEFVDRLSKGTFEAAAIDVNIGLDPDLYPLFASTQVASGGSNLTGIQDVALDRDLIRARAPGTLAARKAAFSVLQARLADKQYVLPIAFSTELVVLSDRVQGPTIRELGDASDRYWDVLTWRLADGG